MTFNPIKNLEKATGLSQTYKLKEHDTFFCYLCKQRFPKRMLGRNYEDGKSICERCMEHGE